VKGGVEHVLKNRLPMCGGSDKKRESRKQKAEICQSFITLAVTRECDSKTGSNEKVQAKKANGCVNGNIGGIALSWWK